MIDEWAFGTYFEKVSRDDGIGLRARLKSVWSQGHVGSTPTPGTSSNSVTLLI